jgi:hypothetical protein
LENHQFRFLLPNSTDWHCLSLIIFECPFYMTFFLTISWRSWAKIHFIGICRRTFVLIQNTGYLLQFVQFEYLSAECISNFVSLIPLCIDHHLWESISRRFAALSRSGVEFSLTDSRSFDGIISYLVVKHCGNVQYNEIVTITSKSVYSDGPGDALRSLRFRLFLPQSPSGESSFGFRRPDHFRESFSISLGSTVEMCTMKEVSQLLRSRLMIFPGML